MKRFAYTAYNADGKAVLGHTEAETRQEAEDHLRARGLFVDEVREADAATSSARAAGSGRAGGLKQVAVFARQLAVLVTSGTTVVDALSALEKQLTDGPWKKTVADIRKRVEEGEPLSEAMAAYPRSFDHVTRSLIAAGESSGKLALMLDRVAALARKRYHTRSAVIGALVYPALLITVSIGVLAMMIVFVLPRFTGMFESLDATLPPSTEALIAVSEWVRGHWPWLIGGLAACATGAVLWARTPAGKDASDRMVIRLPFFGSIARSFATAATARLLGVLLESRVPLLEALTLTRDASNNNEYRRLLECASDAVERGENVSAVFERSGLISPAVVEAIRNGERTGNVGQILTHIANFIDEDNEVLVKSLTSILEPIILLVLGVVVAFVAISMFLPLFDLTASAPGVG